jgi:DNA-binding NarL/FixJ family response regulator
VVVEIDLPDMSGFQVLASLVPSASRPETAVVVLTSLPNPYLLQLALKNGARAALRKTAFVNHLLDRSILDAIASVKNDRELLNRQRLSFML